MQPHGRTLKFPFLLRYDPVFSHSSSEVFTLTFHWGYVHVTLLPCFSCSYISLFVCNGMLLAKHESARYVHFCRHFSVSYLCNDICDASLKVYIIESVKTSKKMYCTATKILHPNILPWISSTAVYAYKYTSMCSVSDTHFATIILSPSCYSYSSSETSEHII